MNILLQKEMTQYSNCDSNMPLPNVFPKSYIYFLEAPGAVSPTSTITFKFLNFHCAKHYCGIVSNNSTLRNKRVYAILCLKCQLWTATSHVTYHLSSVSIIKKAQTVKYICFLLVYWLVQSIYYLVTFPVRRHNILKTCLYTI